MSERYSRVFRLPENLYAEGSPVVIAAGTLLKDNQTGRIVAQLKLRSISVKTIKAIKVKLNLADTAGSPIGEPVVYDYLDLNVSRDAEFGQKNPVPVPEVKARSYRPAVTEVVFSDRTVWRAGDAEWESLSEQQLLCLDREMLKQYRMRFGQGSTYVPKEEKDLWYCSCGALNHAGENCHVCRNSLFELQNLDMAELAAEKDARLAREAAALEAEYAAKEAAAAAAKKKTAKVLKILIPAVCAVAALVILLNTVIIPTIKYNKAVSLMNDGQYENAITAFEAMDGYRDSVMKITECHQGMKEETYQEAVALMANGAYDDAIAVFRSLDGYKDSTEQIGICQNYSEKEIYNAAVALMDVGKYEAAIEKFRTVLSYKDSKTLIDKCEQSVLDKKKASAIHQMKSKQHAKALELFKQLESLGVDCTQEIQQCEQEMLKTYKEPYVTSGNPKGKETKVKNSTRGSVTVHSMTSVDLDNGCVRFTIDCTVPKCDYISFFNPPQGSIFMYIEYRKEEKGRETLVFDVLREDINAATSLTIKFGSKDGDSWIFVDDPY